MKSILQVNRSFPWLRNFPEEMPEYFKEYEYRSLVDLFERSVTKYGSLPAFHCMGTDLSFDRLNSLSQDFACFLQNELRLDKGSRVAIQLPNILQYPITMLGALRAGLIVVNVNPLYTSRELKHQLNDSGAETIVLMANFAHQLQKILDETQIKNVIITQVGDQLRWFNKPVVNAVAKHLKKMVPNYNIPNAISFNAAIRKGGKSVFKREYITKSDVAFLQYTGGTTGVSKGAVLTHGNVQSNVGQFLSRLKSANLEEGKEVILTALPMYHIMALMGNCFTAMQIGMKNVLIPNARDLNSLFKSFQKFPISVFSGVNTLFNAMLNHSEMQKIDFSKLKFCAAGGMAVQSTVASKWRQITGIPITEGYGLTETSPILCFNIPGKERVGTIGLPIPGTYMMIADEEGNEVPIGEVGEVYARGPQVMKEYWKNKEETSNAFSSSGWFKTGDIGSMDEDGYFRILDRKKEMILVSGFNVYPNEIEDVISSHHKVAEVGAIGVPDDHSTEAVKVFVVKSDPTLTSEELRIFCKENLTGYKCPKHIEYCESLPKTNVGKVLRRLLKEEQLA